MAADGVGCIVNLRAVSASASLHAAADEDAALDVW